MAAAMVGNPLDVFGPFARPTLQRTPVDQPVNSTPILAVPHETGAVVNFIIATAENYRQAGSLGAAFFEDVLTPEENSDALEAWTEYAAGRAKPLRAGWSLSELLTE
ncbi:MAG: hypothetical protein L3J96_01175 [Thermoplasmata archaeon]|nr:hypothetical protein [Thermoplasmata archaeon]